MMLVARPGDGWSGGAVEVSGGGGTAAAVEEFRRCPESGRASTGKSSWRRTYRVKKRGRRGTMAREVWWRGGGPEAGKNMKSELSDGPKPNRFGVKCSWEMGAHGDGGGVLAVAPDAVRRWRRWLDRKMARR